MIRYVFALVLMTWLFSSTTSYAQPSAPEAGVIDGTNYDQVYERGRQRAKAEDWTGALADYRRAFELRKGSVPWAAASNRAHAAEMAGDLAEAARYFRYAAERLVPSDEDYNPVYKEKIAARRKALDSKVGTVSVVVSPAGSEITLDGESYGRAPLGETLYAAPGKHEITVTLAGYAPQTTTVVVAIGQTSPVVVELTRNAFAAAADSSMPLWPGWMGLGVGVASAAAGAVMLGLSATADDEATTLQAQVDEYAGNNVCASGGVELDGCSDLTDALARRNTYRAGGAASLIVGGVLAASGIVWLLTTAPEGEGQDDQTALQLTPQLSRGQLGLQLWGAF